MNSIMYKWIRGAMAISMVVLMAWPAVAVSGQKAGSAGEVTVHEPQILVLEEGEIPGRAEKSWFSRNRWYVLGALAVAAGAGAAAAAGGGGSDSSGGSGNSGGGSPADTKVSW